MMDWKKLITGFIIYAIFATQAIAQDSLPESPEKPSIQDSKIKSRGYTKKQNLEQLDNAIENNDQKKIAEQYVKLAEENKRQNDHSKAIHNLQQALNIYTKLGDKKNISQVNRKIAQSQEAQNKDQEAIRSYSKAGENAVDESVEQANQNDIQRLSQKNDIDAQRNYNISNAQIFESEGNTNEAAKTYQLQADLELKHNNIDKAKKTLEQAAGITNDKKQKTEIEQQLATVLAKDRQYQDAIILSKKILQEAMDSNNIILQIDQLSQLSGFYVQQNNSDSAIGYLNRAYKLSIQHHLTKEAQNITRAIVALYNQKNDIVSTAFYQDRFLNDLDSLLLLDKSIVDDRIALSLEQRISDLEQERTLQDQIIQSKNRFNSALLVSIAIMFILIFSIFRSLHSIKRKNKKIALQSLRKEMNPHFIFNSLNSVNQFIAESNELEANKYLTSYSGLMRNIMEHSNKDFVKLSIEIEQLKKYLELEHLRFRDKFDYYIIVDEGLDQDATLIPNMLIQPQLENAIWHGLRYKKGKGRLSLQFLIEDRHLVAKVVDDGIGIEQSQQMKTRHQRNYASIGLQNTKQRIELLNQLYKKDMRLNILSDDRGTTIYFDFGRLKYKTEEQ